jgi:hypothetical protein
MRFPFAQGERGIADDARAVAGGVAGVAQVEQFDGESAPFGAEQKAVDRRRAAGLFVFDGRFESEDLADRALVDALRRGVGVDPAFASFCLCIQQKIYG